MSLLDYDNKYTDKNTVFIILPLYFNLLELKNILKKYIRKLVLQKGKRIKIMII